jgi:Family of unknown function (DUF5318)
VRPRDVVDHTLQRRAVLADLANGRISLADICDAHPYLQLAARHYGEPSAQSCPVCRKASTRHVHYVYGDALGHSSGQAKSMGELAYLAGRLAEFDVYVVEVCQDCGWNHLLRSFVLGEDGRPHNERLSAADG